jgi:molecular chaperone GrpE
VSDTEGKPAQQNSDGKSQAPRAQASTAPEAIDSAAAAKQVSIPPAAAVPAGVEAPVAAEAGGVSEVEQLKADLAKALADASKNRDQLLRTAADFDNFRKRSRRDVEDAQRKGLEKALLELLPVSDNLERAVQASQGTSDVTSIVEGIRMVLRFYDDALTRLGVERVQTVGFAFDPGLHEAVQQVETDEPPGTIVSEMTPGYRLGTKLLRAAIVAVARPRSVPVEEPTGDAGAVEAPQN